MLLSIEQPRQQTRWHMTSDSLAPTQAIADSIGIEQARGDAPRVHPFADRPKTLAEAIRRINAGEEYQFKFPEFLDTFYGHVREGRLDAAQAAIDDEPPSMSDADDDAYIGATAEHLARRWGLSRIPAWTEHPSRFLHRPYFPRAGTGVRAIVLVESPLAFRRRLIFTEASPSRLERARMPRT